MPRTGEEKKSFPNKEARKLCWDAKDNYWACLDNNGDDASKCLELRSKYENSCPLTWVKYFDKRKGYLKFKEQMNKGYEPLDELKE